MQVEWKKEEFDVRPAHPAQGTRDATRLESEKERQDEGLFDNADTICTEYFWENSTNAPVNLIPKFGGMLYRYPVSNFRKIYNLNSLSEPVIEESL